MARLLTKTFQKRLLFRFPQRTSKDGHPRLEVILASSLLTEHVDIGMLQFRIVLKFVTLLQS